MTLIDMLRPEQRQQLRQLRYRIYNREYMRRIREQRKLLCVGVDLPIEAGTCGRLVHAGYQRCIHCTRRRWWLLKHAFNDAEVSITAMLEEHARDNNTLDDAAGAPPDPRRVVRPRRSLPALVSRDGLAGPEPFVVSLRPCQRPAIGDQTLPPRETKPQRIGPRSGFALPTVSAAERCLLHTPSPAC